MAAPEQRNIDWASAEIEDTTLTVELTGASSKAWKRRFERVHALLDTLHSRWRAVHLSRNAIQVTDVQRGAESELRHFLESIVLQVNSELPQPVQPERDVDAEAQVDEAPKADRQMAAAFRAFADD